MTQRYLHALLRLHVQLLRCPLALNLRQGDELGFRSCWQIKGTRRHHTLPKTLGREESTRSQHAGEEGSRTHLGQDTADETSCKARQQT